MKSFIILLIFSIPLLGSSQAFQVKIEAESATTIAGKRKVKSNSNASGVGVDLAESGNSGAPTILNANIISLNKNTGSGQNGYLIFDVTAPAAGVYYLRIYHYNDNVADNTIDITVNGTTQADIVLPPSLTASQGPNAFLSYPITLNSGSNNIKIQRANSQIGTNPQIDFITVREEESDTYYVSALGNDSNDGLSPATAWKSIAKASTATAKPSNGGILKPGDKLLFRRGDTFYGLLLIACSGEPNKKITIGAYTDGSSSTRPKLFGVAPADDSDFEAIRILNASYLKLEDLWVSNDRNDGNKYTYGDAQSYGIFVKTNKFHGISKNLDFLNLKITDVFGWDGASALDFQENNVTGLRFEAEVNEVTTNLPTGIIKFTDVLIKDCEFSNIGKAGIWAITKSTVDDTNQTTWSIGRNERFKIINNTFTKNGGSGVILSKMKDALIQGNIFDHPGYPGTANTNYSDPNTANPDSRLIGRGSGAWVFRCVNVIAQYNTSLSARGDGDSYGMHIDFGNTNIIFQYNYSENAEGGFCEILGDNQNCIYRFNISVNDGFRVDKGNTIWFSDYVGSPPVTGIKSTNNYVYNNSIFVNAGYSPEITLNANKSYIFNNVFRAVDGSSIGAVLDNGMSGANLNVGNNLFSTFSQNSNGSIGAAFKALDATSVTGNPKYTSEGDVGVNGKNGYSISSNSDAIDEGKKFTGANGVFPAPIAFPGANSGIFQGITSEVTEDIFGNPVDMISSNPNIGAVNLYNQATTLGVTENKTSKTMFGLLENPIRNNVRIKLDDIEGNALLTIYNIQGVPVFEKTITGNTNALTIDLPQNIINGIYVIRIEDTVKSHKIQCILSR